MRRLCLASLLALPAFAFAQGENLPDLVSHTEFRVCADPHNLPYSNEQQEGFENKVAALLAQELGEKLSFTWFPDSQGFLKATIQRHRCDVVMSAIAGEEGLDVTTPYYHTGFVMVSRSADKITTNSLGDPTLQGSRFGLIARSPVTELLLKHNLMNRTSFYELVVDTRVEQPAHQMLLDIVDKKIDVGIEWGPFAGYYAKHDHLPLVATFIDPEDSKVRFDFRVGIGVRPNDVPFRRRLNAALAKRRDDITRILQDYGIPLLDEQNKPIPVSDVRPG